VVGMALRYRAMGALAKGLTMGVFGLWVIGTAGLACGHQGHKGFMLNR